jgi:acetyl-CoA synthetase
MRTLGIGSGTRVGLYLPNCLDAVAAFFALARVEAIVMPIFSGFGSAAVADRLRAFDATHLITADTYLRRGRSIPMKETADAAVEDVPSVQTTIVIRRAHPKAVPWRAGRDVWWHEVLSDARSSVLAAIPTATHAETPLMVLYTSGTTGRPKGTVHTHGGFAVKVSADLTHTFDVRPMDSLLWLSDLGWLMGPLVIVGAALLRARLVLYEGAIDYPAPDRLWSLVARHKISHLGLSPTAVRALRVHGTEPVLSHDLGSLRVFGSTGEPWDPESWGWLFEMVGRSRVPILNYSGGTEVGGGILGCTVLRPIRPASFNGPCLGMAADVVDEAGRTVRGKVGELVIRQPWPGMTRGFWEEEPDRYLETYWRSLPGLWQHGDLAVLDADGYWYVLGRSDDTLNIAGKRVGPSEIESAAVSHPAVIEAAAIGVPHKIKGTVAVVVVVLHPNRPRDTDLERAIGDRVAATLGSSFRPHSVVAVPALPHTRSGKIMRRFVRAAFLGADWGDITSVENPEALAAIADAGRTR